MNKFYVFFVITLICTLPVHHANALSVKVTDNVGNAGVDGYLNGNGDVWELTASLTNLEYPPTPSQVFLEIGSASTEFTSCSGDGTTAECKFISDLSDGIEEGSYSFKVAVYDAEEVNNETVVSDTELGSDTENVYVDSDSPIISFLDLKQDAQDVMLDFVVYDPDTCSGLKTIEVYNNDGGEILDTITFDESGTCEYDYETGNRAGELPAELSDQGSTELRVRATDYMGIQGVSNVMYFTRDFVLPVADTLSFPGTESIGELEIILDEIQVNITECSGLTEVLAVSEQINFMSIPGDADYKGDCHYEVTWEDISFTPTGETVTVTVVMQDQYENIGEDILTYTFDRDTTAPEVDFFGTSAVFEEVSYMADDVTTDIVAHITEAGSGIEPEQIIASFAGLGITELRGADYCVNESVSYECVWEDISSGAGGEGTRAEEIRLVQVMDVAGNDYGTYTVPLIIDDVGPTILDLEIESVSETGDSKSFKSGDDVRIQLELSENSGLQVKIDVHDLIMDSEVVYDYGTDPYDDELPHEDNGYAVFTQDSCQRNDEGYWECEFVIENIRTGYVSNANFNLLVYDTAGNFVEEWNEEVWENQNENVDCNEGDCDLTILAADYDTLPDLWEQGSVTSQNFILLDTSDATYPRQDFEVSLHSSDGAIIENYILAGCSPPDGSPAVSRPVAYGGLGDSTNAKISLIVELEPFDKSLIVGNREDEFLLEERMYNCSFLLQSSRNNVAYVNFEEQTVEVPVTFGFSEVGSMQENTQALIDDYITSGHFKTRKFFNTLNTIMQYAQKVYGSFKLIFSIVGMFNVFKATSTGTICTGNKATGDQTCAPAVTYCDALEASQQGLNGFFHGLNQFLGLFFCSAAPVTVGIPNAGDLGSDGVFKKTYDASISASEQQKAQREAVNPTVQTAKSGVQGQQAGQTFVEFTAVYKAWQTAVVTLWTFIRGGWMTASISMWETGNEDLKDFDITEKGVQQSLATQNELAARINEIDSIEDKARRDAEFTRFSDVNSDFFSGSGTINGQNLSTVTANAEKVDKYNTYLGATESLNSWLSGGTQGSLYDNIWVSSIGLCIPGIIYNVQKLYVADCMYLSCLKNDVPMGLATVQSCTDLRNYMTCKFVVGEIAGQVLGQIGNFIDNIMETVVTIFADPFSLIIGVLSVVCGQVGCKSISIDQGGLIFMCNSLHFIKVGSGAVGHVQDWVNGVKSINVDQCDALIEEGVSGESSEPSTDVTTTDSLEEGGTDTTTTTTTTVSEVEEE